MKSDIPVLANKTTATEIKTEPFQNNVLRVTILKISSYIQQRMYEENDRWLESITVINLRIP